MINLLTGGYLGPNSVPTPPLYPPDTSLWPIAQKIFDCSQKNHVSTGKSRTLNDIHAELWNFCGENKGRPPSHTGKEGGRVEEWEGLKQDGKPGDGQERVIRFVLSRDGKGDLEPHRGDYSDLRAYITKEKVYCLTSIVLGVEGNKTTTLAIDPSTKECFALSTGVPTTNVKDHKHEVAFLQNGRDMQKLFENDQPFVKTLHSYDITEYSGLLQHHSARLLDIQEFCEHNLRQYLGFGSESREAVLGQVLDDVVLGLVKMEKKRVIHRGINPLHIQLKSENDSFRGKISGLGSATYEGKTQKTDHNLFYMSPEVLNDKRMGIVERKEAVRTYHHRHIAPLAARISLLKKQYESERLTLEEKRKPLMQAGEALQSEADKLNEGIIQRKNLAIEAHWDSCFKMHHGALEEMESCLEQIEAKNKEVKGLKQKKKVLQDKYSGVLTSLWSSLVSDKKPPVEINELKEKIAGIKKEIKGLDGRVKALDEKLEEVSKLEENSKFNEIEADDVCSLKELEAKKSQLQEKIAPLDVERAQIKESYKRESRLLKEELKKHKDRFNSQYVNPLSSKVDVWSYGQLIYEVLFKKNFYAAIFNIKENDDSLIAHISTLTQDKISAHLHSVSTSLKSDFEKDLFARLECILIVDPSERPTATELQKLLGQAPPEEVVIENQIGVDDIEEVVVPRNLQTSLYDSLRLDYSAEGYEAAAPDTRLQDAWNAGEVCEDF